MRLNCQKPDTSRANPHPYFHLHDGFVESTLQPVRAWTAWGGNPRFAVLPQAERDLLPTHVERQRLPPGVLLFRQGDPVQVAGSGFFCLVDGLIKVSSLRRDGREAILAVLEPGNWFGEISLLDGSPRTHDATALTAIDVLVVPPEAFAAQMQRLAFA